MKLEIWSTEQIVELVSYDSDQVRPARVWVGETESGIPVQVLVVHVAVAARERQEEFLAALQLKHAPEPAEQAFPPRMLL